MTPGAVTRSVDGLVRRLFAPLEAGRLPPGWRVLGWDAEQGLSLTLARGAEVVLVELEDRSEERPCYARTGRFNVCARHALDAAVPLSPEARAAVDRVVAVVQATESWLPDIERVTTGRRTAVREILVERALIPEGRGQYYLNPYVGCVIGCEFCYVAERADLSRRLEGLPRLPWGRYVDVKVNAPEVLREEVRRFPPGVVRLSPILTDPYQPIERTYRITRRCLEVLLAGGFTPVILTRAGRIVEDLELLARFPRAAVGFTIPTDDDRMRRCFEPGADPIAERLEALRACHRAGLRTFGVVQPMLPMDAARLAGEMAPHVSVVRIDRMYEIDRVRHLYAAAGAQAAATDAFFTATAHALRTAFTQHGVVIDDLDDLGDALWGRG